MLHHRSCSIKSLNARSVTVLSLGSMLDFLSSGWCLQAGFPLSCLGCLSHALLPWAVSSWLVETGRTSPGLVVSPWKSGHCWALSGSVGRGRQGDTASGLVWHYSSSHSTLWAQCTCSEAQACMLDSVLSAPRRAQFSFEVSHREWLRVAGFSGTLSMHWSLGMLSAGGDALGFCTSWRRSWWCLWSGCSISSLALLYLRPFCLPK